MSDHYEYGERHVAPMPDRALTPGRGRITGYVSAGLGLMSLLGVLCFRYPTLLTTDELRELYDVDTLRLLLHGALVLSIGLGATNFLRNQRKRMGAVGLLASFSAYALGGPGVEVGALRDTSVSFGLDYFLLDLLLSATLFVFIEKIWPKYPEQAILRPHWRTDLTYFAVNHLLIGVLLLVSNRFVPLMVDWAVNAHLQEAVRALPIFVQAILLTIAADFVQYWVHRAYHEVPALWKLHAVHHSSEHMDWLAGSRTHVVEVFLDRILVLLPLYLLGPDKDALDAYVIFAFFQAVLVHANFGMPFGPLVHLVVTPQYHHWHHSSDKPAIDTNYAVHLPFWDRLFGTQHLPKTHWPIEYGTVKKIPTKIWEQLLYPFIG